MGVVAPGGLRCALLGSLVAAAVDPGAAILALWSAVPVTRPAASPLALASGSTPEGAVLGCALEVVREPWRLRLEALVAVDGPAVAGFEGDAGGVSAGGAVDGDEGAFVFGAGLIRGPAGRAAPGRAVSTRWVADLFGRRRVQRPAAIGARVRVVLLGERHPGASIVDAWRRSCSGSGWRGNPIPPVLQGLTLRQLTRR